MIKLNIIKNFKLVIDIILCSFILLQSIKKGGFYSSDIYFFITSIAVLGAILGLAYIVKHVVKKDIKFNIQNIKTTILLFALLAVSYLLPILFNTAANVADSEYEFFRYLSIFIVYLMIRNSDNKKIYYYTLISIGILQVFIGIDGLGNRVLQPFLKQINSGFLSKDLTRLSGTIQYANTAAILIAISGILILDKINTYVSRIKQNNKKIDNLKLTVSYMLFTVSTLAVILTGSRLALTIYIITSLIYLLKSMGNKFNLCFVISMAYITSFLGSNNILDLTLTNPSKIYFVFFTYMVLSIILIRYIVKYVILNDSLSKLVNNVKFNKLRIAIILSSVIIIYTVIGLNMFKPLDIVKNEKENVISRQIYGLIDNDLNNISITIEEDDSSSKYSIVVYEESNDFARTELTRFEYYDNTENNFNYTFRPKKDTKRLHIDFICFEGSFSITEFKLNDEIKPLEYSILPSEMVFRFWDSIGGSTSLRDRLHYIKDSFKIWLTSPIFGTGGEGFKHLYKEVQTFEYTSSEAHNSILQVFVESGIIGGIALCLIIYLVIRENKFSALKLAFIMYIVHSFTDLNFSYLICLIVFSMLIGIMENKNAEEKQRINVK